MNDSNGTPRAAMATTAGTGPCSEDRATDIAARAARALADAGLLPAPDTEGQHPAVDGYAVEPMRQVGPARAAVRWHHARPRPHPAGTCGDGLDQCRAALTTAGYLTETVYAANGPYLAVLLPVGARCGEPAVTR